MFEPGFHYSDEGARLVRADQIKLAMNAEARAANRAAKSGTKKDIEGWETAKTNTNRMLYEYSVLVNA